MVRHGLKIPSGEHSSLFAVTSEDAWELMLEQARALINAENNYTLREVKRHASVSTDNRHSCRNCFCCACVAVLEEHDA